MSKMFGLLLRTATIVGALAAWTIPAAYGQRLAAATTPNLKDLCRKPQTEDLWIRRCEGYRIGFADGQTEAMTTNGGGGSGTGSFTNGIPKVVYTLGDSITEYRIPKDVMLYLKPGWEEAFLAGKDDWLLAVEPSDGAKISDPGSDANLSISKFKSVADIVKSQADRKKLYEDVSAALENVKDSDTGFMLVPQGIK